MPWDIKEYLGPAATIIASFAALIVSWHFNRRQSQISADQRDIAASQRDIAIDRLKYDVFEKRYEIYLATKSLVSSALRWRLTNEKGNYAEIRDMRIKIDEARFFFPTEMQKQLEMIDQNCEALFWKSSQRENVDKDDPRRRVLSEEISDLSRVLQDTYAKLPSIFERDLGFANLTRRITSV